MGSGLDIAHRVLLQADGKVVLAGYSGDGDARDFSVVRLNADGTLDTSFSGDGKLIAPVGSAGDVAYGATLQADGKIILTGSSYNGSDWDFSLIRLNANGTLDTSFGSGGKLLVPVGSGGDEGQSVVVQPDGKIIVAGYSDAGSATGWDYSLVRLNANGTLDTSFGSGGKVFVPVAGGNHSDDGRSVLLQADGKIVVAGNSYNGSNWDFSLIRLNANGTLDTTFSGDGKLLLPVGSGDDEGHGSNAVLQADGKIVVAGYSHNGSTWDLSLTRINPNGTLDTSFSGDGKLIVPVGDSQTHRVSVVQQADGKLVVAATGLDGTERAFLLVRVNPNGSLDSSFGTDGTRLVGVSAGWWDYVSAGVVVQPDGGIVVAGQSYNGTDWDFSVARLNADGSLDRSFNAPAPAPASTLGGSTDYASGGAAVVLDADVAVFAAGLAARGHYAGASVTLARQGGANSEDLFGASGSLSFTGSDAGNVVLAGTTIGSYTQFAGSLSITFNASATQARVNAALSALSYRNSSDAPPDAVTIAWTFNDGNAATPGTASGSTTVAIDAPTVAGIPGQPQNVHVGQAAELADISVADKNGTALSVTLTVLSGNGLAGGTLGGLTDADPARDGIQLSGTAAQINAALAGATFTASDAGQAAIQIAVSDGAHTRTSIYTLAAQAQQANTAPSFALPAGTGTQVVPVGSGDGDNAENGYSVALQADGKIIVAGWAWNGSDPDAALIRLNVNGTLDTSFGGSGKLLVPVGSSTNGSYSVEVQPDGKIVLSGSSWNGTDWDISLIRLNANGTLDTSFSGDGKLTVPVGSANDRGAGILLQADGKIVVAGTSHNGSDDDFALVRINANGTLDTSFGDGGKVVVPVGSGDDAITSGSRTLQQPDGKIVVAGFSHNGTDDDVSIVRFNADGSLDTGFNGNGKLILPLGSGEDQASDIALQSDGKIVVTGLSHNGTDFDLAIVRLNADGTLDTGFGTGGKLLLPVGAGDDVGSGIKVQADGKIVVTGNSLIGEDDRNPILVRLNPDGTLDMGFGNGGKLIVPVSTGDERGRDVVLQADGKIVVGGYSDGGFLALRFNADGSLDTTFNAPATAPASTLGGTRAFTEDGPAVVLDEAVAVFDAELAAQGHYAGASITLARQDGANAQDLFGASGKLVLDASGKALLDGVEIGSHAQADGSLTITFNASATQARVNAALSALTYSNTSDTPPASVTVAWSFSDGNAGAQGTGGAKAATGSVVVNISAVNDAPTIGGIPAAVQSVVVGAASALADFTVADGDGDALTVTLTASNGSIGGLASGGGATVSSIEGGFSVQGSAAAINALLANATFTASAAGAASIGVATSDGKGGTAGASYALNATEGDQPIVGTPGNDLLQGSPRDEIIDGGAGLDWLQSDAPRASHSLSRNADGSWQLQSDAGGSDELHNVERLRFSDGALALDLDGNAGHAARLVGALAGAPAVANTQLVGLALQYIDALGAQDAVQVAVDVGLVADFAGGSSDAQLIAHLYAQIIGQTPTEQDVAFYANLAQEVNLVGAAQVLTFAAGLQETADRIDLVGLAQRGLEFDPFEG